MALNKLFGLVVFGFISVHISECKVAKQENLKQASVQKRSTNEVSNCLPRISDHQSTMCDGVEVFPAYTSLGEPCKDLCLARGFPYTWCNKVNSSDLGTWLDSDYCTTHSDINPYGEKCSDDLPCTPENLLARARDWLNAPKGVPLAYTVRGDPCKDDCIARDDMDFTSCTKSAPEKNGEFVLDYCTKVLGITAHGVPCQNECGLYHFSYSWCNTESSWGYCTLPSLIDAVNRSQNLTVSPTAFGKPLKEVEIQQDPVQISSTA